MSHMQIEAKSCVYQSINLQESPIANESEERTKTDGRADRQVDRPKNRQTCRHTDKQAETDNTINTHAIIQ